MDRPQRGLGPLPIKYTQKASNFSELIAVLHKRSRELELSLWKTRIMIFVSLAARLGLTDFTDNRPSVPPSGLCCPPCMGSEFLGVLLDFDPHTDPITFPARV